MKQTLEDELITKLTPFLKPDRIQDAQMHISMILSNYDVRKEETQLAVYEGDINENIMKRWLMAKIARGCSSRTINLYKNSVKFSLERIGKPYNEVTSDDVRVYLAVRVQKDGVTKTTANNERRNLSAFYFWLQKEEILLSNPMNKVEVIKQTKIKKKAFTQMDLEKMRYECRTSREVALFEVLISTWARITEVAEMQIRNINGNKILVRGKGDKEREVFLNARAQMAIERYLGDRKDNNPYLFPRAKYAGNLVKMSKMTKLNRSRKELAEWYKDPEQVGESHSDTGTLETIIRNIGERSGVVKAHPHRFRRTGATMALRSGMPLITVSKILGHENIGTTQIYLDISDQELEQSHKKYVG